MLFKTFLTLLTVGVALCDAGRCSSHEECDLQKLQRDFPDTVEELEQVCNDMKEVFRCIFNDAEACSPHTIVFDMLKRVVKYVEENCDEDSHVFEVISRNLGCVSTTARTVQDKCSISNLSDKDYKAFLDLQRNLTQEYGRTCVEAFKDITCFSHILGLGCGSDVKDVAADILINTSLDYRACDTADLSDFCH